MHSPNLLDCLTACLLTCQEMHCAAAPVPGRTARLPSAACLFLQDEVSHALTHELVHAYDHCRAVNLDWTNCQHHACSEIRAAALSGALRWMGKAELGGLLLCPPPLPAPCCLPLLLCLALPLTAPHCLALPAYQQGTAISRWR